MYRGVLAATAVVFACAPASAAVYTYDLSLTPTYEADRITAAKFIDGTALFAGDSLVLNVTFTAPFVFANENINKELHYLGITQFFSRGENYTPASYLLSYEMVDPVNITKTSDTLTTDGQSVGVIVPITYISDGDGSMAGINLTFTLQQGGPVSPDLLFLYSSAIPEPATWALMIAGFGLVGGAVRRRSPIKLSVQYAT
jgi:hypothetical protein